jgi:arginyl-tRNA synthetase
MLAQLKASVATQISAIAGVSALDIQKALEVPKNYDHGHLSWPLFNLAKNLKQNPQSFTLQMKSKIENLNLEELLSLDTLGGFLNFKFKPQALAKALFSSLESGSLSKNQLGNQQTVVIDYSSPNVAKKMHVGHLRGTIIGQAIVNLHRTCGFRVVGLNHLGDWGTQFGKLAWSIERWGSELGENLWTIDGLLELYVKFHEESEKNPQLEALASAEFLKLEKGDAKLTAVWKKIIEVSMVDYNRIYQILNVSHDQVIGESFYNQHLQGVVDLLKSRNLLQTSEGAQVVMFEESEKLPPCLIQKSDGASLYATRDLASAIYRHDVLKADQLIYIVGAEQTLHFRQVFKVLQLCGFSWAQDCHHISHGLYRFKEGKMSTRKGRVIHLEDVLETAVELITEVMKEKRPELLDQKPIIQKIAIGAVIFNDLMNDRSKNVEFDWDRAISTEGDSGPYVQYMAVRCKSILKKRPNFTTQSSDFNYDWNDSETKLIYSLLQFQEVVKASCAQFKPNLLAQYLLQVCTEFSHFYHLNRVLDEPTDVEKRRLSLVFLTQAVLVEGLGILGIDSPDVM